MLSVHAAMKMSSALISKSGGPKSGIPESGGFRDHPTVHGASGCGHHYSVWVGHTIMRWLHPSKLLLRWCRSPQLLPRQLCSLLKLLSALKRTRILSLNSLPALIRPWRPSLNSQSALTWSRRPSPNSPPLLSQPRRPSLNPLPIR